MKLFGKFAILGQVNMSIEKLFSETFPGPEFADSVRIAQQSEIERGHSVSVIGALAMQLIAEGRHGLTLLADQIAAEMRTIAVVSQGSASQAVEANLAGIYLGEMLNCIENTLATGRADMRLFLDNMQQDFVGTRFSFKISLNAPDVNLTQDEWQNKIRLWQALLKTRIFYQWRCVRYS